MRALTWLLGVMLILLGLECRAFGPSGWTAVWIAAAVLWFFVGCVLGFYALAKFLSGKTVAGLVDRAKAGAGRNPAAEKERP